MPRTNSLSDSEGRSLTPDLEDEGIIGVSPTYGPGTHHGLHLTNIMSRKSHHTHRTHGSRPPQTHIVSPSLWRNMTPLERFRAAGRKVIAMRRGATLLGEGRQVGGEPGIDPRRESDNIVYGQIHKECTIELVDYSAVRCNAKVMTNDEFVHLMDGEESWKPQPWVKCRWINIGGVSWDVIKALSLRYHLHPLALEDVFHKDAASRSKADYYTKHLFIRVMCHELGQPEQFPEAVAAEYRPDSPLGMGPDEGQKGVESEGATEIDGETLKASISKSKVSTTTRRRPLLPRTFADVPTRQNSKESQLAALLKKDQAIRSARTEREVAEARLNSLKQNQQRVHVKVQPMYIFLYRDGTVITLTQDTTLSLTEPVSLRLKQRDGLLRSTADHSMLVHALLDTTVDKALKVVDEYRIKITSFEERILLRPDKKTVKQLHILSGDLTMHKRTLDPVKTLILGLRRYDVDRVAALIDMSDPANKDVKVVGYMSHKSKIYLADVYDHIDYILTSLDMFTGIGENLIDYTFNLASYEMNEVMRQLTLATIIFLPLTLLTGYFGMNFEAMWSLRRSDLFFWQLALPVMAVVVPLFMWEDIRRMIHYIAKRIASARAEKAVKSKFA